MMVISQKHCQPNVTPKKALTGGRTLFYVEFYSLMGKKSHNIGN